MGELNRAPDSSSTVRSADDWLREQATLDWQAAGMQSFDRWDHALSAVARLVAVSTVPMALMLGRRGVLLANPSAECLFAEQTGEINGRSVLDVLPAIAPFYSAVLTQVFEGRSITFRKQPVRLVSQGVPRIHWFNLDFTPIASPRGEVLGALGIANEITRLSARCAICPNPSSVCVWRSRGPAWSVSLP